jgi:integrase
MGVPGGRSESLPKRTLTMSLYRRGRIWWIKFTQDGRRIRESSGTTNKKEAQAFHEKRKGEVWRQVKLGEAPPVTWGEAVAKWMSIKPRDLPDRYRIAAFGISPSIHLPLSESEIASALGGGTAGSFNRSLALVTAIHNASNVTPPKIKRRKMPPGRTRWLNSQEWSRLKSALEEGSSLLAHAAEFTLATGLRENNVLELEWGQIDLRRRVAWLHGDQMKGKVALGIPLNDAALAVLEARRGIHKRWVFGNPDYPLTKASNRAWYAAVGKAKLKGFRWHDLRHTWASWAVMSGVRLEELMKLGGWKSYSMVLRYAHLAPEHMAEAASKIRPVAQNRAQGSLAQR